mmetsp:Transcript_45445/g.98111  ORF Transcript_45445/g.98111 Transcript_45445/m.98111 type:complete len:287 (-) Transcript_45445:2223-3083(-)
MRHGQDADRGPNQEAYDSYAPPFGRHAAGLTLAVHQLVAAVADAAIDAKVVPRTRVVGERRLARARRGRRAKEDALSRGEILVVAGAKQRLAVDDAVRWADDTEGAGGEPTTASVLARTRLARSCGHQRGAAIRQIIQGATGQIVPSSADAIGNVRGAYICSVHAERANCATAAVGGIGIGAFGAGRASCCARSLGELACNALGTLGQSTLEAEHANGTIDAFRVPCGLLPSKGQRAIASSRAGLAGGPCSIGEVPLAAGLYSAQPFHKFLPSACNVAFDGDFDDV